MKPTIGADHAAIHASWQEVLDSGVFTEGKYVRLFEEAVEDFYGQHAVAVNSAGSGLFAVGRQLVPRLFLAPTNTFLATVTMTMEAGHGVALADASFTDLSVNAHTLHEARGRALGASKPPRDMGVVLTHVGGWVAQDYDKIGQFCREAGMVLVEDAAHALGLKVGQHALATVFSLYPTKAVPVGDGGVIITQHRSLAGDLKKFRNYGKSTSSKGVISYAQGFNLRMDEWTAVVAYHQFKRVGEIMERRAAAADKLKQVVAPLYPQADGGNWYKYVAPATYPAKRQAGKVYLSTDQAANIMESPLEFPNAKWISKNHICLPIWEGAYEGMTPGQIEHFLQGGDYEGS